MPNRQGNTSFECAESARCCVRSGDIPGAAHWFRKAAALFPSEPYPLDEAGQPEMFWPAAWEYVVSVLFDVP